MKITYLFPVCILAMLLTDCSSHELSRNTALGLIKKEFSYPKVYDWNIFTGDPEQAKKILDAGLEKQGYAVVQRTQRMADIGKPWVTLTEKSKEFWLPTKEEDKKVLIQKVRAGEEDIAAITSIKLIGKGKKAVVEYTTEFRNLTPFAVLAQLQATRVNTYKAYFSLTADGWRIEKKPDLDFLTE